MDREPCRSKRRAPRARSPRGLAVFFVLAVLGVLTLSISCSTKSEAHSVDCMKGIAPTGPMGWFAPEQIPQRAACSDDGAECRFAVAFPCGPERNACPVDGELCTCSSTGTWSCDREVPGACACVDKSQLHDAATATSDATDADARD
jgi:hypothetical protein